MRDILDALIDAEHAIHEIDYPVNEWGARVAHRDALLSLIRERIAAGDECAFYIPTGDSRYRRHSAAVKACEEAVKGSE